MTDTVPKTELAAYTRFVVELTATTVGQYRREWSSWASTDQLLQARPIRAVPRRADDRTQTNTSVTRRAVARPRPTLQQPTYETLQARDPVGKSACMRLSCAPVQFLADHPQGLGEAD